jgi:YccS/YhfK family integral membrane protein
VNDSWLANLQWTRNHEGFMRGAQALLALSTVLAVGWEYDWQDELMTVLLGVLASAFTETDDNWSKRLQTQLIALCVFSLVMVAVWATLASPVLLALALAASAFLLTMLGAVGERYRAIAFGALVLFIYTALSAQGDRAQAISVAPYLLGGAAWYGLVSLLWAAAWPMPTVRHRLSTLYSLLGEYLRLKAQLFEPVGDIDMSRRRLDLALHNGRVVDAFNAAKESLFSRLGRGTPSVRLQQSIHQYLAAQDIHERVSSSHESYVLLAKVFARSDALYRCERVLCVLGEQAHKYALAIRDHSNPQHTGTTARAIEEMQAAIHHLDTQASSADRPLRALRALGENLTTLATVFAGAMSGPVDTPTLALQDRQPQTLAEAWSRIRAQLSLHSALMRHAVRLALSLLIAFGVMRLTQDPHGFWILLTVVFVSQPQYGATLQRLGQRALGTVVGLGVGWALIRLFPGAFLQAACTVLAGTLFIGTRQTDPRVSSAAITTLVLLSFHQMGMSQGVIPARLLDTALGSAIAALAAWLILPNWQARHWPRLAAQTLKSQAGYLREILLQYQQGKQDHLAYRVARRNAHNADAALSNAYSAMANEPVHARLDMVACGRFLLQSHMLLSYLSALGAHRGEAKVASMDESTAQAAQHLLQGLEGLAHALDSTGPVAILGDANAEAGAAAGAIDPGQAKNLLLVQLRLANRQLPVLRQQAALLRPATQAAHP